MLMLFKGVWDFVEGYLIELICSKVGAGWCGRCDEKMRIDDGKKVLGG